MTLAMPKVLVLNSSEKSKPKAAVRTTEMTVATKGKFLVLNPVWENGASPVAKDASSSPANNANKVASGQLAATSLTPSTPLRSSTKNPKFSGVEGERNLCINGVHPDGEEAAFLRFRGWEENDGEDEGLTEEEINAFYEEYMKLRPSLKLYGGMQPKLSVLSQNQSGSFKHSSLRVEHFRD